MRGIRGRGVRSFGYLNANEPMDISIRSINVAVLTREHSAEVFVRRGAMLMCMSLLLCYAYLAGISVFHAVVQRSAEVRSEEVRTTLAELEREHFTLNNSVEASEGFAIGLGRVAEKSFVERTIVVGQAGGASGL